ncbi:MAG TPA: non-homologous end-joining DNA ligase [Acidimicrobiales bacterium]|nr:non-homologous end-joining DNA ligase [Acidimicrobiales bacterium]
MAAPESREIELSGRTVAISNPDKIYFPELGATKFQLVEYYAAIEEPLLRATGLRPALMQRFPEGATGKSWFQKRVPAGAPEWLRTVEVSTPNGTTSNALVIEDLAHVAWAVNLGCIGFHLWPFRVDAEEFADELRIDLDPSPGLGFDDIRAAAYLTRDLLDELGITVLPKTSGNRGLHLYARLERRWDSIEVRAAAVAFARELERRHPDTVTAKWWKEERGSRVFIDFNQNAPHKTVFGAWSARPRTGGQVSTPLHWDELDSVDPDELNLFTVPKRVGERGDPWEAMATEPQSIEPLLELSAKDKESGLMDAPWPPQYPKMPDEPSRVAPSRARKEAE